MRTEQYTTKKLRSQDIYSYIVKHVSEKGANRIRVCGSYLNFAANKDLSKFKLYESNFCENRFCPMCAWRQAKKDALKIGTCMKYIELEHNKQFIFITFTAPNVPGEDLKNEISKYNKAFFKLMHRKQFKDINKGYARKIEITYNKEANTYHPHMHVIMAVNKRYFKSEEYIRQNVWLSEWCEVMDDYSITQVHVSKVKAGKAKQDDGKRVNPANELAKYVAKDSDMTQSQDVFDTFYNAIKGQQIMTYNGLFKDAVKLYKAGKLDKYMQTDMEEYVYMLLHQWGMGDYVLAEQRELTPPELKRINKQLIDEADSIDD